MGHSNQVNGCLGLVVVLVIGKWLGRRSEVTVEEEQGEVEQLKAVHH